jgi:outer membrane protein assembly factor BamD (BamD/ComL family)
LLAGNESPADRNAAAEKLEMIVDDYEGTPEASEALRLLQEVRAEEEAERLAKLRKEQQEAEAKAREEKAASKLHLARVFMAARKESQAKQYLRDVIDKYAETKAAGEAREMLEVVEAADRAGPIKFGRTD